jgi:membrane protein YqaA with SNARE-associated domain
VGSTPAGRARFLRCSSSLPAVQLNESIGLGTLFLSSFLAATLLPGGSELASGTATLWPALAAATLGNTLGGMSSYLVGRLVPEKKITARALDWVRRRGTPVLLLSWVPLIGDALCVAAGWLRLNPWWSALFIALGKFGRYCVIAGLVT